jgi:ATP-dependent helicase/nuclease subunit A
MATIDEVKLAKQILDSAEKLNDQYAAGIQLPTIQTPSQIKKRYEHFDFRAGCRRQHASKIFSV